VAAFHHGDTRCLVFPWADGGTLRELFGKEAAEIEAWCNAEWVWKACLGISEGLHHMHQPPHAKAPREGPSVLNVSPPSQQRDGVSRGEENENESETQIEKTSAPQLHADIKPENILCFSTVTAPNDSGSRGGPYTLRLADLGLAKPISEPNGVRSKDIQHTLTYRPPEQDLDAEFATQQWDIWALGCLFLEFVIWFLEGPSSLEEFQKERQDDVDHPRASRGGERTFEDTFFRVGVENRITSRFTRVEVRKKAKVKGCVIARIHTVKEKSRCTGHLRRLLGFIEEKMLVVDPTKRATTEEVVKFFRGQPC
jgi:serine/threonine protein kinase